MGLPLSYLKCICEFGYYFLAFAAFLSSGQSVRPVYPSQLVSFISRTKVFFLLLSSLLFLSFTFFFILLVVLSLSLSFHQFREQRKNKNSSQVVPKTAFPVELSFNLEKREEMAFLAMPRKGNLLKSKVLPTARALKSNPLLTLMGKF